MKVKFLLQYEVNGLNNPDKAVYYTYAPRKAVVYYNNESNLQPWFQEFPILETRAVCMLHMSSSCNNFR